MRAAGAGGPAPEVTRSGGGYPRPLVTPVAAAPLTVRTVHPDEYEAAGALVVSAYEALPGAHLSGGYAAELADVARRAREAEVLVALDATGLLGCATYVPGHSSPWAELLQGDEAGLRMLAVRPASQRRGAGRALLEACVGRARSHRRSALMLHTTPWMTAAHRLYEGAGFVRFPERDWMPEPDVPLLAYRLSLR